MYAAGVHRTLNASWLTNRPSRVPLCPLPLIEVPFERIGMVLVGNFTRVHVDIALLVLVGYVMRYPEAAPLCAISAKSVVQVLFKVISQVGILKEILTDQDTSFMSRTLRNRTGYWASNQFRLVCTTLRPMAVLSV